MSKKQAKEFTGRSDKSLEQAIENALSGNIVYQEEPPIEVVETLSSVVDKSTEYTVKVKVLEEQL